MRTPSELAEFMALLTNDDPESSHGDADMAMVEVLRGLGYGEAMDAYENLMKWYA